jgi:hypothetical protein
VPPIGIVGRGDYHELAAGRCRSGFQKRNASHAVTGDLGGGIFGVELS